MSDVTQATTSKLVDELLQLVGLDAEDVPNLVETAAPIGIGADAKADRLNLVQQYDAKYKTGPAGASAEQLAPLIALRLAFTTLATQPETEPKTLSGAFDAVAAAFTQTTNDTKKIEKSRATAARKLEAALPAADRPHVIAGATAAEAKPLADEYARLATALAPQSSGAATLQALKDAFTELNTFVEQVTIFKQEVQQREEARQRLTTELNAILAPGVTDPDAIIPGATADDVAPLVKARDAIQTVLSDPAATLAAVNLQSAEIGDLGIKKGQVADIVTGRAEQIQQIVAAASTEWASLLEGADPAQATSFHDEIAAIAARRLDDASVLTADRALTSLRDAVAFDNEAVAENLALQKGLQARVDDLRRLMQQTCAGYEVGEVEGLLAEIEDGLGAALYEIDFDTLDEQMLDARRTLDTVVEGVVGQGKRRAVPAPTQYLVHAAQAAAKEGARLLPFAGQSKSDLEELPDQLTAVKDLLGIAAAPDPVPEEPSSRPKGRGNKNAAAKTPSPKPVANAPSIEALNDAMAIVTEMRTAVDTASQIAGAAIERLTSQREALLGRVGAADPAGLPPGFAATLAQDRKAVTDALGAEMSTAVTQDVVKQAIKDTGIFERDLGDATTLAGLWNEKVFDAVRKVARTPLLPILDAARAAVLAASADIAKAVTLAQALAALVARAQAETGKAAGAKQAIGAAATGPAALDAPATALMYDLVGPDALTDPAVQPGGLATLCACFKQANATEQENLRDLVNGGFGGEGKLLAGLVRSNDAAGILALARAFGGAANVDDRKRLGDLVAKGGLGEAPKVLDDLLGYGVAGAADPGTRRTTNIAQMKALGVAFGDADGPARLKTLVADCGLGQARPTPPGGPGIMAEALQSPDGLAGDADALRLLADGYAGTTPTDAANRDRLSGLVGAGGFGGRPKAFAPLLKRVSDQGGAAGAAPKLKEIGTAFQAPADRAKLKTLLESGGLSGDTGQAMPNGTSRRHEHGDTLAKIFTDGLGNRADKLKDFATAFGDTGAHAEECRQMVGAWNEFPDDKSAHRQPGDKVKRLLAPNHFNNDVSKLQRNFTDNMKGFGENTQQRKLATRFAPHFDQSYALNVQPDLTGTAGTEVVMGYLAGRHAPKYAKNGVRGGGDDWLADDNSYFPVDTTPDDIADMIGEAMNDANAPGRTQNRNILLGNGITVEIAVKASGAIVHCVPIAGKPSPDPEEISMFTRAESERIFRAVRP